MDEWLSRVVVDLGQVAARLSTRVLLVGAYARDLCLGITEASRATNDADFAVLFESWAQLDTFFSHSTKHFRDIDRAELKMYHKETSLKVDIVPCGPIEEPPGILFLRGSQRQLNTAGLAECFDLGRRLDVSTGEVLLPPPAGFIVLKLFAFAERRELRDLRDLGHVLHRYPVDDEAIWDDDELMEAFALQTLNYDDTPCWQAGRYVATQFTLATSTKVVGALDDLLGDRPDLRAQIIGGLPGVNPDNRLQQADRVLMVLRRACGGR
jgi:predicted nucleotidyltransferase